MATAVRPATSGCIICSASVSSIARGMTQVSAHAAFFEAESQQDGTAVDADEFDIGPVGLQDLAHGRETGRRGGPVDHLPSFTIPLRLAGRLRDRCAPASARMS